jgi:hypothetical protein
MTLQRKPAEHTPEFVRDVSVAVYKTRLGTDDAAGMIAKHGEAGLRKRAGSLDPLTRAYLQALRPMIGVVS